MLVSVANSFLEGIFWCSLFPILFASNQLEGLRIVGLKSQRKGAPANTFDKGDLLGFTKAALLPCILCFEACKCLGNIAVGRCLLRNPSSDQQPGETPVGWAGGPSNNTKQQLVLLNSITGLALFLILAISAQAHKDNESAFAAGKNAGLLFSTIISSCLTGLSIGAQRQIIYKYIDDIYDCLPLLNRYKQRHEALNKGILAAQNFGLFLGSVSVLSIASATKFASALSKILKLDEVIVAGTSKERIKTKVEIYGLIQAQYRFHVTVAFYVACALILAAVVVITCFKEVDRDGRHYASQVFKDGLLVASIPGEVNFTDNSDPN